MGFETGLLLRIDMIVILEDIVIMNDHSSLTFLSAVVSLARYLGHYRLYVFCAEHTTF
jgi:hypothetical protein